MKRVVIVRHAKAEPYGYDDDFNRDLIERGISDATRISTLLRTIPIVPDLVMASPARRTIHTAGIYCENLGYNPEFIRLEEDFYDGINTSRLIQKLHLLSDEISTVFVVGHNPTVHTWVYNLAESFFQDMPTCATVVLDFDVENWQALNARAGKVAKYITPKTM